MKLSIVIVNYNVKYFLEQCLLSVKKAIENIEAEVFVVDNKSADGSCDMVRHKFPKVKIIANNENTGFSKANNQAIRLAKGEYILLLNPDTLVQEDTFETIINFMDANKEAGALGVKMIDGKGNFLPESKRALPSPWVAFYKIFGLSKLFPKSKKFGRYHLSYLNENEINEVEILSGAFMFIRKKALDKSGLLDENFFMYGEDIDLSYRIIKAGYKNYYFPKTTIIHYKGESTKKGSINYVLVFYNAMIIFAKKHFSASHLSLYLLIIKTAIWFRASVAILNRILSRIIPFLWDFATIYSGITIITEKWEQFRFKGAGNFPEDVKFYVLLLYSVIWILSIMISGGYRTAVKLKLLWRGTIIGTIIILLIYSVFPAEYRFSRAIIFMGAIYSLIITTVSRLIFNFFHFRPFIIDKQKYKRTIIIGNSTEVNRVTNLLEQSRFNSIILGYAETEKNNTTDNITLSLLGEKNNIEEIIRVNKANEIIFCAENMTSQEIIKTMLKLSERELEFKIAIQQSLSVIGSKSINTAGDLYDLNISAISKRINMIKKRLFDISSSLILLSVFPLLMWKQGNRKKALRNITDVIKGNKTWVGYTKNEDTKELPKIRNSIFSAEDSPTFIRKNKSLSQLNITYAGTYSVKTDFEILIHKLKCLDKT